MVASRLEVVDGKYTGEIDYYAYGKEKARAMQRLAEERGYDLAQCYAYSDSVTDVPMLAAVGFPHAVNPDKDLRKEAAARGWPVLVFVKPVALRTRVPLPPAKRDPRRPRRRRRGGRRRCAVVQLAQEAARRVNRSGAPPHLVSVGTR